MNGKVCLVTGASTGIGKAAAVGLARLGATVVMVSRDPARGQAALAEVKAASKSQTAELMLADLSSQAQVRQLADQFRERHGRLDVLINNMGGIFGRRLETADGLEWTFAVNHLAPFLLTNLLLDTLKASAPARVVNLTSEAQGSGRIHFDDLQLSRGFRPQEAYAQSKLANVMFTFELSRRLEGSGVTTNCVHPGVVRTNFASEGPTLMKVIVKVFAPLMRSPEKGAETVIYLASSPEVEGETGKYYSDKHEIRSNPASYDAEAARRLWEISENLTGLTTHNLT